MASTLTWSKLRRASSTHPGCQPPLKKKHGFAPSPSHPGQNRGHRWRWWRGPATPEACTCSQAGTKCCCCRGSLPPCPATSPGGGPRRSGACSPGGGSTAPRLLLGRFRDSWTQKCARRAYTGCSPRRTAHRPPGSRRPPLRRDQTKQPLAQKLAKLHHKRSVTNSVLWLAEPRYKMHTRTCGRSTAD